RCGRRRARAGQAVMSPPRRFLAPVWSLLKAWGLSLLVFALVAAIMVGQFMLGQYMSGAALSWYDAFRMAGRDWLPWAIVAPFIFMLVFRLPLERDRWFFSLPALLLCGIGAVAFCNWWSDAIFPSR